MYAASDSFRTPAAEDRPFYAIIGYHIRAGFASIFWAFSGNGHFMCNLNPE